MPSLELLSRSGITSRVDLPNDVMTFWVRRGLVRPINAPSGMGRHLRFEWYEANIAAVMNQLRMIGVSIDGLLSIAGKYRDALSWASDLSISRDDVGGMLNYRILLMGVGRGDYSPKEFEDELLQWGEKRHLGERVTDRIISLVEQSDDASFRQHNDAFLSITEQPDSQCHPESVYYWRVGSDWRFGFNETGLADARQDGALGSIAIDVPQVLYNVWNRP